MFVVDIATGSEYSFFVTDQIKLYACGNNQGGRCGLNEEMESVYTPTLVELPPAFLIKCVVGALFHSFFLSTKGQLLSCGASEASGHGSGRDIFSPEAIPLLQSEVITSVAAGPNHSLCSNEKNEVWSWGDGS